MAGIRQGLDDGAYGRLIGMIWTVSRMGAGRRATLPVLVWPLS